MSVPRLGMCRGNCPVLGWECLGGNGLVRELGMSSGKLSGQGIGNEECLGGNCPVQELGMSRSELSGPGIGNV